MNMKLKTIFVVFLFLSMVSGVFAQAGTAPAAVSADSNGKISLELKGMDVVEALKMIAAKGNFNIVIGTDVQGKVTLFLKEVDVRDAFDIILLATNLAIDRRGDIIYVMSQRQYEVFYGERYGEKKEARTFQPKYAKATEAGKLLELIKTKVGKLIIDKDSNTITMIDGSQAIAQAADILANIDRPTVTKMYELSYASAKDLKERIAEMLTKDVGNLRVDERTNKFIITDTEDRIREIEHAITSFDQRLQEVLIDARIIEITLDDNFKLGVDWQAVIKKLGKEINLRNAFKLAAAGAFIPGAEILIGSFGSDDWAALIQILKTVGDTNTLSNPRVMTLNNQEAKILVGTNQPYATNTVTQGTSTTTTATNLTFIDIGVKLYVTPVINKEGYITMKIRPEVSSQSGTYTYGDPPTTVPIISTTQAETNVMVKDGTTIIIAGLISDNRTSTVNKVPFLGDIPVIGYAFKNTVSEVQKKELVIFLTPHIISPDVDQLRQVPGKPEGEKIFTMPEWPTFERRAPVAMNSGYLNKRYLKNDSRIDISKLTPEEYFSYIRDGIMANLRLSESDKAALAKGDKAKVLFAVYSGGSLAMKPEVRDSTNRLFAERVSEAIERSSPFPRLPMSIKETMKTFALEIIYDPDYQNKKGGDKGHGKK